MLPSHKLTRLLITAPFSSSEEIVPSDPVRGVGLTRALISELFDDRGDPKMQRVNDALAVLYAKHPTDGFTFVPEGPCPLNSNCIYPL